MPSVPGQERVLPCRFCGAALTQTFVDLGKSPLCESFLRVEQLEAMEPFYPLHVRVCDQCFLVQLRQYVAPDDIFTEYAYFSSYSDSWLAHAKAYAEMAAQRFGLGTESHVVEIASNDGYLLQYFVQQGIPVTGIDPAANVAEAAREKGVPTVVRFFGVDAANDLAAEGKPADLIVGNNVLAHVPDINDLVGGIAKLLKPSGVVTMEFPHLHRLIEGNQFDTIYHEHFSYLSFTTVARIFEAHGLVMFDVEELATHGGSLRVYAQPKETGTQPCEDRVERMLQQEAAWGYTNLETYLAFQPRVVATKHRLLSFLIEAKAAGRSIAAYGAPGKGNTLLNYCGIRTDFLDYAVDRNPYKHGRFCPGTEIPIHPVARVAETRPDYLLILPWNLKDEIMKQMAGIREWGGKFVVPIPEVRVFD